MLDKPIMSPPKLVSGAQMNLFQTSKVLTSSTAEFKLKFHHMILKFGPALLNVMIDMRENR